MRDPSDGVLATAGWTGSSIEVEMLCDPERERERYGQLHVAPGFAAAGKCIRTVGVALRRVLLGVWIPPHTPLRCRSAGHPLSAACTLLSLVGALLLTIKARR